MPRKFLSIICEAHREFGLMMVRSGPGYLNMAKKAATKRLRSRAVKDTKLQSLRLNEPENLTISTTKITSNGTLRDLSGLFLVF